MLIQVPFDLAAMARGRRAQLKLGQADVAREVGVGRQWIGKFEAGEGAVEFAIVLRTCKALGLELRLAATCAEPAWAKPLTAAAGTRSRPYGRHRRPRRTMILPDG